MKIIFCLLMSLIILDCSHAQWTEPERLQGPINTADSSSKTWPSINATEDTIYYAKEGLNLQENICYSYRYDDSSWSAPIFMPSWVNSADQRDLSPSIGPGDSTLYFVTYERPGGYGSYDIWFTRRGADGQWMEPENAGPNINTPGMEWGVFLSRDGQSLYLSSTRFNPGYGLNIGVSHWNGIDWEAAVGLSGGIDWIDDEENVTLPTDESYMIVTVWRYAATRRDLFLSTPSDSGWSRPERIDPLSSTMGEVGASLTSDGSTIYMASERDDPTHYKSALFVSHRTSAVDPRAPRSVLPPKSLIYPNPYQNGELRFVPGGPIQNSQVFLSLHNILGQQVVPVLRLTGNLSSALPWSLQELPAGTYFLNVTRFRETEVIPFIVVK
jgi:hypothetical protein